jgi:hypothetical protein
MSGNDDSEKPKHPYFALTVPQRFPHSAKEEAERKAYKQRQAAYRRAARKSQKEELPKEVAPSIEWTPPTPKNGGE